MTTEKKDTVRLKVRVKTLKLLGFQVTEYGNNLQQSIPDDKYEVQFEFTTNLNIPLKIFHTILLVRLLDKSRDIEALPELANMRLQFDLLIINFDDVVKKKEGTAIVPDSIIKMAFSSAIAAARGMFVLCSTVYKFSNAIIPLINIDELWSQASKGISRLPEDTP